MYLMYTGKSVDSNHTDSEDEVFLQAMTGNISNATNIKVKVSILSTKEELKITFDSPKKSIQNVLYFYIHLHHDVYFDL